MRNAIRGPINAAELAVFERKKLSLDAASTAGLPGRFESFQAGGLWGSIATDNQYGFLNTIEGLNEQNVEALPDQLKRFPTPNQATIVATSPSQSLIEQMLGNGYELAPVRPIAYLCLTSTSQTDDDDQWQIRESSTTRDVEFFASLLASGYAATSAVKGLICAEHTLPEVRGFTAFRDGEPLAAAALSLHSTAAVLGGASTLPAARGLGAQSALLKHRLRVAGALGVSLAAATAVPGGSSIRNLAKLGFTVVERTAWRCHQTN